ncbi:restriction endonuclease subunit S [Klebsiella aerogenes]
MSLLSNKLDTVEWGAFSFKDIFENIYQGRRLKKDDQIPGHIPFVMAGVTNSGVANYISNPVTVFPENSITIDIFGNTFYRDYSFGAGDDTGVYWSEKNQYSKETMKFFAISMSKALEGKFDFGKKLRSSQSLNLKMMLPVKSGMIDFDFINDFIMELEAEQISNLDTYLSASGLNDYHLTPEEQKVVSDYDNLAFSDFNIVDIFSIKNSGNILSRDIVENSGDTPYLCASRENNSVHSYISYDEKFLDEGNCVFIGGKTFVVSYQQMDFYSNDSHNLILYVKNNEIRTKLSQLFLVTCIDKSLGHKYSWGDSISNAKIQKDRIALPVIGNQPDLLFFGKFISAIQKIVIKDLVEYVNDKVDVPKETYFANQG